MAWGATTARRQGADGGLGAARGARGLRFLLPWLIGLVVFILGPIVASVCISMTDWNLMNPPQWVGLDELREMFADRDFWQSLDVTLKYILLSVPLTGRSASRCRCCSTCGCAACSSSGDLVPALGDQRHRRRGAVVDRCSTPTRGWLTCCCAASASTTRRAGWPARLGGAGRRADGAVGHRRQRDHLPGRPAKYPAAALRGRHYRRRRAVAEVPPHHAADDDADAVLSA